MENEKLSMLEKEQAVINEAEGRLSYEHDIVLQVAIAELDQARVDYEDDLSCAEYRNLVYRITEKVLKSDKLVGSADDVHNYSVELARRGEYVLAVQVLKKGLNTYPRNTDLLADILQYCCCCGEHAESAKYYFQLKAIPKFLWTWRAFSFSIDYIKDSLESSGDDYSEDDYNNKRKEMCDLANAYCQTFPYLEDSYVSLSDIYYLFGDKSKSQDILEEALSKLKVCPKCALKLADMFFERGEMVRALEIIKRGLLDANQVEDKINTGYLYLLSGLSKTSLLHGKNFVEDKKEIISIYEDFNIALEQIGHERFKKVIRNKIIVIRTKTNIEVPDKYESLVSLL